MVNPRSSFPAPCHGVLHHIITPGRPVTSQFWRLDPAKLEAAKKEFEKMEADGIIQCSAVGATLFIWYRNLMEPGGQAETRGTSTSSQGRKSTLCLTDDLGARLHECKLFTKLDMKKGKYQIPFRPTGVHTEDRSYIPPLGYLSFWGCLLASAMQARPSCGL